MKSGMQLGPSIYDVHMKIGFLTPPPLVHMRPHEPEEEGRGGCSVPSLRKVADSNLTLAAT